MTRSLARRGPSRRLHIGHEYLVFREWEPGERDSHNCSATQPSKMAVARIEQLLALRDGSTLPDL